MKTLSAFSACLVLVSGAVLAPAKVSYDGYKVFRVSVGEDVNKLNDIISKLSLTTWKGKPKAGRGADVVVPPSQLDAFTREVASFDKVTMHEDLGASIADEGNFHVYASWSTPAW